MGNNEENNLMIDRRNGPENDYDLNEDGRMKQLFFEK